MIRRAATGFTFCALLTAAAPAHAACADLWEWLEKGCRRVAGGINHGSTLYVFGRYTLDTKYNR